MATVRNAPNVLLALTSAILLIAAFPSFNQPWAVWVALAPWLILLRTATPRQAFYWSWGIGLLFFLGSLWWLIELRAFAGVMAVIGWIALSAYLALFFGLFGFLIRRSSLFPLPSPFFLLLIPSLWVSLEYARAHLLTGFGWNLLAYSQTAWLPVIQMADVTGAWGVSFLIVMVNLGIASALVSDKRPLATARGRQATSNRRGRSAVLLAACCLSLVAVLLYGAWRLPRVIQQSSAVRMAVVQGNIPQEQKWDDAFAESILTRYEALTRTAAATTPDLIVWSETATPGYLGLEEALTQRILRLAREAHAPLLVGAPMAHLDGVTWRATNSAVLVGSDGSLGAQYDKLHLVPFGEFIPFERQAPWVRNLLPPIGNFVPGERYTVFHLDKGRARPLPPFSTLICFEDLFPELARRFVRAGARALLVITNDAWFGPTAAAYQHAQASTLRAVELRVPIARAANTGWSGCIDPAGRWIGRVREASGAELFVAGTHTCELPRGVASSVYLRWGDWFAWACVLGSVGGLVAHRRRRAV